MGVWAGAKPIETSYHGHRFRSRIEARWAVFFDAIGIPWQYEVEGFDLDGIAYLPDFWLPQQGIWVEIKGMHPTDEEEHKAALLAEQTRHPVYIFSGEIKVPTPSDSNLENVSTAEFYEADGYDVDYCWCECPSCGAFGVQFEGRSDRLPCKECRVRASYRLGRPWRGFDHVCTAQCEGCRLISGNLDRGHTLDSPRLVAAYEVARAARFEFR